MVCRPGTSPESWHHFLVRCPIGGYQSPQAATLVNFRGLRTKLYLTFSTASSEKHGDRESLVVKVTDSWPVCHEFEPGTIEDPPCRRGRCTLNMLRLKRPSGGVMWKLGEGVPAQVSSSLDHCSKLRSPSPKSPRVAE
ncbi:hypothetical protein TNCV_1206391 [Trichonephila clavipes]|nr:hypothetical protein TNCV_1206391 [Trichonephila clavipes]